MIKFRGKIETWAEFKKLISEEIASFYELESTKKLDHEAKKRAKVCEILIEKINLVTCAYYMRNAKSFADEIGLSYKLFREARTNMFKLFQTSTAKNRDRSYHKIIRFMLKTPYIEFLDSKERDLLRRAEWEDFAVAITSKELDDSNELIKKQAKEKTQHLWSDSSMPGASSCLLEMLKHGASEEEILKLAKGNYSPMEEVQDGISRGFVALNDGVYSLISPSYKIGNEKKFMDDFTKEVLDNHSSVNERGVNMSSHFTDVLYLDKEANLQLNEKIEELRRFALSLSKNRDDNEDLKHVAIICFADTFGKSFEKTIEQLDKGVEDVTSNLYEQSNRRIGKGKKSA